VSVGSALLCFADRMVTIADHRHHEPKASIPPRCATCGDAGEASPPSPSANLYHSNCEPALCKSACTGQNTLPVGSCQPTRIANHGRMQAGNRIQALAALGHPP